MKYLLLICWGTERMNGQTEPEPGTAPAEEGGFPWADEIAASHPNAQMGTIEVRPLWGS
jgi:hypothetical protein